jgi:hypothetical protein
VLQLPDYEPVGEQPHYQDDGGERKSRRVGAGPATESQSRTALSPRQISGEVLIPVQSPIVGRRTRLQNEIGWRSRPTSIPTIKESPTRRSAHVPPV